MVKRDNFAWACCLCALPVLIPSYPAMVDLPQHAAMIAGMNGWLAGTWKFAYLFDLQVFTPYLLGYGLILSLSGLLGVVLAAKVVIALTCVVLPWSAGRFLVIAGVDKSLRWPLLLIPFGFAYDWGFVNFIVALPFGFMFLCSVLEWRDSPARKRWIKVALWLHFLFFAHLLVAGFFGVVAAFLLTSPWRGVVRWLKAMTSLMVVVPAVIAWLAWTASSSPQSVDSVHWAVGLHRLPQVLALMVSSPSQLPGVGVALLCIASPFVLGLRPRLSVAAIGGFAFYFFWMMFFPNYVFGTLFSYQRFATLGLPLYFLIFQDSSFKEVRVLVRRNFVIAGMVAVATVMLGWHSFRAKLFSSEVAGYREVISKARPDSRLLYMALDRDSAFSAAPVFMHFGGWYQAEHGGFSELSFARFWITPLKFKDPAQSSIDLGFEWNPERMDWDANRGELYDYLLIRSVADQSEGVRRLSRCQLQLLASSDGWWIYERSGLRRCEGDARLAED